MIRKLILATAAVIALSVGAQAANTVTTIQVAPLGSNSSTTTQAGLGNNFATLAQFAGISNTASATQASVFGGNVSTMFQAAPVSNSATVGQTTVFGPVNISDVIQIP